MRLRNTKARQRSATREEREVLRDFDMKKTLRTNEYVSHAVKSRSDWLVRQDAMQGKTHEIQPRFDEIHVVS